VSETVSVTLWLTPEEEERLTAKDLAEYLGISAETCRQRLRTLGPDHYLTYYPGNLPMSLRRIGKRRNNQGYRASTLGAIVAGPRLRAEDLDMRTCVRLIGRLITRSRDDYLCSGCSSSRSFLLNETGMLAWYLELVPGIDVPEYLAKAKAWIEQ
jgi:hypothetical protein